jgi:hypothetical protein
MERQRPFGSRGRAVARREERTHPLIPFFLAALGAAALLWLFHSPPARAENDVVVDGDSLAVAGSGKGMPSSNPRVQSILAAHPNQLVVICVAGCDGKPKPVQILPLPVVGRVGQFVPSAATTGKGVYGPEKPGAPLAGSVADINDVVCVAGCNTRPGQVLQRITGLPPPPKVAPKRKEEAVPKEPSAEKNEPLEVNP